MGVGDDSSGNEDIEAVGEESLSASPAVKDSEGRVVLTRSSGTGGTREIKGLAGSPDAELESTSHV